MKTKLISILSGAALLALGSGGAKSAVIIFDGGLDSITGVANFVTLGDAMAGMTVRATFADGFTETLVWAATGPGAGGVTGDGWSVNQSGDTFNDLSWAVDVTRLDGQGLPIELSELHLEGAPGLTLFDVEPPNGSFTTEPGTENSASGKRFVSDLADDDDIVATYSNQIQINADPPVGDLWHTLTIDFSGRDDGGVFGSFAFSQDADSDERLIQVPEPFGAALLGFALLGFGMARRRR
jgi:hypothetical protein